MNSPGNIETPGSFSKYVFFYYMNYASAQKGAMWSLKICLPVISVFLIISSMAEEMTIM